MSITRALGDETRVRMLLVLEGGELCVCQVTELFGLAVSTVSKHLSILYQAGLVESRKEGRWIYYRLPGREASVTVREALDWVGKSLGDEPRTHADWRQLAKVLRMDPKQLCKRQCRS